MNCGDYGLATNSPKGSLRLLVLLPAVCSPANLPKVPNINFARRLVLLVSLFSAHLKVFLSPSLIIPEHKQKWNLIFTKRETQAQRGSAACPGVPRAPG